ncbi:nuclear transport factor 2 family protein [Williamsia soli]|uniref:nuclear transport factor 2 family protein n=1 Tax=Williamsia soli TaxID=364929 RepID=UPI003557E83F
MTTNLLIDIDEESGIATARSYFTVLQALSDLPLQTIVAGRYADRFDYVDGHWRFADRQVTIDLFGDVSRHLRHTPR